MSGLTDQDKKQEVLLRAVSQDPVNHLGLRWAEAGQALDLGNHEFGLLSFQGHVSQLDE